MHILRNHIVKEFLNPFVLSCASLLFVFLTGRGLVQMADLIFNKNVNAFLILQLLFYSFPFILIFVIPVAVLIATLLAFGRLSFDNEIIAIRASGIPMTRIIAPLCVLAFILSLGSFLLNDQVASASHYTYRKLLAQIGVESPAAALEEGTFIKKFKNFVIFIYEIDKNKLKGVRIYQPQEGKPTRTIIAQKGELVAIPSQNIIKLRLIHGTSDEPDPKDPAKLYKLNFKTYDLPLNVSNLKDPDTLNKKPKDMSIKELKKEIIALGESGIKASFYLSAEIHNKMALALSSFAFLLLGIPLGMTHRRNAKSFNFAISLACLTVYWLLLLGGKVLAQKGLVPPFLALQFSNLLIGGLGFFLLSRLVKT